MYKDLTSNGPKEHMEHPKLPLSEFLPDETEENKVCHRQIDFYLSYMTRFMETFGLHKYIHFKRWVEAVRFDQNKDVFVVQVRNLDTQEPGECLEFDYVIVATGHFNYPNIVEYPGQETFPGKVIHSKYFIDASRYKGQLRRCEVSEQGS